MSEPRWHEGLLSELQSLELVTKRRFFGSAQGERRSARRGGGLEFADHRPYVPGDDIRALDWNAYRAHRRLFIREFEEQQDLSVTLLIDCSYSMAFHGGAKFRMARRLALGLAYLSLVRLDCVSAHGLFSEKIATLPPLRGREHYHAVLRFLDALEPRGVTNLAHSIALSAGRTPRRGLAILLTDGYDREGLGRAFDVLESARFEPVLVEMEDTEDIPDQTLGEVVLVDMETDREQGVWISRERVQKWREHERARRAEMAQAARSRGVAHARVDVAWPLQRALGTLERAGVLRR